MRAFFASSSFNKKAHIRLIFLFALYLALFNCAVILSYYLLPEGFLRGKNSVLDFETSKNAVISAVQIFGYNMISAALLLIGNIFTFAGGGGKRQPFMPLGYSCMMGIFILNGITLGTWSFTVVSEAPDLAGRLLRTFDIFRRAGLLEMTGQMFIVSATARIALTEREGGAVYVRSAREMRLSKTEAVYIVLGLCLMFTGAVIESVSIISHS